MASEQINQGEVRCECGCLPSRHEDGEGACTYCVSCKEFAAAPAPCSCCGEHHDPDISSLIAEDLS